ncbi:MAG: NifB/NifX family molybdenum-iron cluster-binding protein [Candidatus Eremiobacterota bacterium]
MRLAVATEGGNISQHFGQCSEYTIADIQDKKILNKRLFTNPGHQGGGCSIPHTLHDEKVDCVIAGGMGQKAIMLFEQYGIKTYLGVSGSVDKAIDNFINGSLVSGESTCDSSHGEGHDCGHHH